MSSVQENPSSNHELAEYCLSLGKRASAASRKLAAASGTVRTQALDSVADLIESRGGQLLDANTKDLGEAQSMGLSAAMIDRLRIDEQSVQKIAQSVRLIARQMDPIGEIIEGSVRPNGIRLEKIRVPIGVILIIYESRPNVTSDAAALCIKSGNAVILRGGREAKHSNAALAACVRDGLQQTGLDPDCVQLVETTDRKAIGHLLQLERYIDVAIPRGGESLIRAVVEQSHIPVIKHYTGNCHVYVDAHADDDMAVAICINAKTQRTGVCNAAETILVHRDAMESGLLKRICDELGKRHVVIRGDAAVQSICAQAEAATESDWDTEYLDLVVAMRVVDSLEEAVTHINRHGSRHTDAIVTRDIAAAESFIRQVDTANAFVNCSTRFSDGGEYGLGAEIGISTDKLHARGPMGARDLTTYKWVARGNGQIRT